MCSFTEKLTLRLAVGRKIKVLLMDNSTQAVRQAERAVACSVRTNSASFFALALFVFAVVITSGLAGWVFFQFNFSNHLETVADEADAVLAISSSYVSVYSQLRNESEVLQLPVPANFRALAHQAGNSNYSGEEHFRTIMVGMPDSFIVTAPTDSEMAQALVSLRSSMPKESYSQKMDINGSPTLRTIYPSYASQQSCVDCHNSSSAAGPIWKLGDMMGAFVIERGIGQSRNRYAFFGFLVALLVALLMVSLSSIYRQHVFLKLQSVMLKNAADTDPLTGCLNRRALTEQISLLTANEQKSAAILLLDIDHFKKLNDTYGHDAGDKALVDFANTVRGVLRKNDLFVRTGGEEFTIYMPDLPEEPAKEIADRIRKRVWKSRTEYETKEISFTVSIGAVHTSYSPAKPMSWYSRVADNLLYKAKAEGRNRVIWSS